MVAKRNVRNELLEAMRREQTVKGQRLASIRDISLQYKVSKAVAERAVRSLIADGICIAEHGRGIFLAVDSADLYPTATIGVVFGGLEYPRATNPFFRQLFEGTMEWIEQRRHNALKFYQWSSKGMSVKAREWAQFADRLSGTFVIGDYSDSDLLLLRASGLPVVVMDYDTHGLGIDCVIMDNTAAMHQLTDAVLKKNAGNAFLVLAGRATLSDPAPTERRLGFERALAEHGRSPSLARAVLTSDTGVLASVTEEIAHACRSSSRPPVVLAEDGGLFLQLSESLAERGLRSGTHYLAGYVNSSQLSPELSVIPAMVANYDFQDIGRAAAKLLDERMKNGLGRARRIVIEAKIREVTA